MYSQTLLRWTFAALVVLALLAAAPLAARGAAVYAAPLSQDAATPTPDAATFGAVAAQAATVQPTLEATSQPSPAPATPAATLPPVASAQAATAQPPTTAPSAAGQATITSVDVSAFPEIRAYVQLSTADGRWVPGLSIDNFALMEAGAPVDGLTVVEDAVGVQVVFVLDTSAAFSARDANGITRLGHIQQALASYAEGSAPAMRANADDVTILAPEGAVVEHSSEPALVAQAVEAYASQFAGAADNLALLYQALDQASITARHPGMPRLVIFVSNGILRADMAGPLADVAARAAAGQVTLHTVFVGPTGAENIVQAQNLKRLAEATGGQFVIYAGHESFGPIFQQLVDLGRQYRVSYRSRLAATGQHSLSASVSLPGGARLGPAEAMFPLRVEAPVVKLSGLSASVVRVAATHDSDPALADPAGLDVPLLVDFPDGHPRGLRLAELVVDGQVVAAHRPGSPLEAVPVALTWLLAAYSDGAPHTVQMRIVDEVGLAAESQTASVAVSLEVPAAAAPGPAAIGSPAAAANPSWVLLAVAGLAIVMALAIGVGAWLWVARQQAAAAPRALADSPQPALGNVSARTARRARPVRPAARPAGAAVETETAPFAPVPRPPQPSGRHAVGMPSFRWPGRPAAAPPPCANGCLELVTGAGDDNRSGPRDRHRERHGRLIELGADLVTLGRDPAQAEVTFADRSVSRLHARIVHEGDTYRICDEGSTSGTWVNYTALERGASRELKPGDLVNLGRVQLRFILGGAAAGATGANGARVVKVTPAASATVASPAASATASATVSPGPNGTSAPDRDAPGSAPLASEAPSAEPGEARE